MSVPQTVLVFVLVPLAAYVLVAWLAAGRRPARRPRYRPGEPWRFAPVWWIADPEDARLPDTAESQPGVRRGGADGGW